MRSRAMTITDTLLKGWAIQRIKELRILVENIELNERDGND